MKKYSLIFSYIDVNKYGKIKSVLKHFRIYTIKLISIAKRFYY